MHQTVDIAVEAHEHAEIRNGLDLADDVVALVVVDREVIPGIRLTLLDAERDAPALLIDVEHHHLDLVVERHHPARMDVLVGPVHLGYVHQPLDASSISTKHP